MKKKGEKKGKVNEENLVRPRESETSFDHSSITSSSSSYTSNHKYQNCRESDYVDDEIDYEECDLDDYEYFDDGAIESKDRIRDIGRVTKEADGLVE